MTTKSGFGLAALTMLTLAACGPGGELEVRTFPLENVEAWEVVPLVEPYVYDDRESHPGTMTSTESALTVRETADNLERIARVLAEYDRPSTDVRLHFQLIEADGFREHDPRIADLEEELRKVLRYDGYRLTGEAFVSVSNNSEVRQQLQTSDGLYQITGAVDRVSDQRVHVTELRLWDSTGVRVQTSVNVRVGQTLVLGSAPKAEGSSATLLLTVRAAAQPGPS